VAPILYPTSIKEFKTKPLQMAVKSLQSAGLQPDIIFCRCDRDIPNEVLDKVCTMTNVDRSGIFN